MAKIILDKISSTAHIETAVLTEDVKNGQFVTLGLLQEDGESRVATKATDYKSAEAFIHTDILDYGYDNYEEIQDVNPAGKQARAYILQKGDTISVEKGALDGLKLGDLLTVADDGYLFKKAEDGTPGTPAVEEVKGEDGTVTTPGKPAVPAIAGDTVVAKIIGEESQGFDGDMFVITFL